MMPMGAPHVIGEIRVQGDNVGVQRFFHDKS